MERPELLTKTDISPILRAHIQTLSNYRTGLVSRTDLALFFGVPALIATILEVFHFGFRIDAVNGFLNAFAILTGLMLNLLVLVFTISTTMTEKADFQMRKRVLREVFVNVCFCILIAVLVTITALTALVYAISAVCADRLRSYISANVLDSELCVEPTDGRQTDVSFDHDRVRFGQRQEVCVTLLQDRKRKILNVRDFADEGGSVALANAFRGIAQIPIRSTSERGTSLISVF
jgi:hypothetical protein